MKCPQVFEAGCFFVVETTLELARTIKDPLRWQSIWEIQAADSF
jgi:hypothetical protein